MNLMRWFRRKFILRGEVCTIHVRIGGTMDANILQQTVKAALPDLQHHLESSLAECFGADFEGVRISSDGPEVVVEVIAASYLVNSFSRFEKVLKLFTYYARDLLNRTVGEKLGYRALHAHWTPAPSLIRMELVHPENHPSVFARLAKHPAVLLAAGTIVGSLLLPEIQSCSNARKVRHDERIKLALAIIDQNRDTNSQLVNLRTALELFAKDHVTPEDDRKLMKEQDEARAAYNIRYLSFNAQAWWWHWATQMDAQLSALAKPKEATRIKELADQYNSKLEDCVGDLAVPWNRLLRDKYDPANWKNGSYDTLLKQTKDRLDEHNVQRGYLALKMAEEFASD